MFEITEKEIADRFRFDNPWWTAGQIETFFEDMPRRAYFDSFKELVIQEDVRRAVVLMGPRRVGKTVMLYHTISDLLGDGVEPERIFYVSLDTPVYSGVRLELLLKLYLRRIDEKSDSRCFVLFDEIQYHKDWEVHLKSLVDSYRNITFVASGSAAAALRMKSTESGAGRFTDFMLPPLTFAEYLRFIKVESILIKSKSSMGTDGPPYLTDDIESLNKHFVDYINFGGYPEAVLSERIQEDTERYIRSDIIDKVLLGDLPSLYGIRDIQELNRLFMALAFRTGTEVNYESLSRSSGVAKNTLRRYLDYLEAAFLIVRIRRVDNRGGRFKRDVTFKVYLTNPSMRAALFGQVNADHKAMGNLVETAIFSQWSHRPDISTELFYARWRTGEVDMVWVDPHKQKPLWALEIKWTDRGFQRPLELSGLIDFAKSNHSLRETRATTKTRLGWTSAGDIEIEQIPASLYCYIVGKNVSRTMGDQYLTEM